MMKGFDKKLFVLFALSLCYIFIIQSLNILACEHGFFIMLPAVFIVPAALFLTPRSAFLLVFVLGLVESSFYPVKIGLVPLVWLLLTLIVSITAFRFRNIGFLSIVSLMELVNFLAIVAYCIIFPRGSDSFSIYFMRVFSDALMSGVVLAVVGYCVVLLPRSIMYFMGENLNIQDLQ